MPFSISPRIHEVSIPDQTVHLHVWGRLARGDLDAVRASLGGLRLTADPAFDITQAMQPGGAVIYDYEWGRNLPYLLSDTLFEFGLSLAWIAPPAGSDPRGSYVSHAGMQKILSARSDPARTSCDLVECHYGCAEWAQRLASVLFEIAPRLGVPEALSNHQRIHLEGRISAAQEARCVEDLEVAAGWKPLSRPSRATWKARFRALFSQT